MLPVSTAGGFPPAIAARSFVVMSLTCRGFTWKSSWPLLKAVATPPSAWSAVMPPQPNHHSMTVLPGLIGTSASGFGVGVAAPAAAAAGAVVAVAAAAAGAGAVVAVGAAAAGAAAAAAAVVAVGAAGAAGAAAAGAAGAAVGDGAAPPPQAVTNIEAAVAEPRSLRMSRRFR